MMSGIRQTWTAGKYITIDESMIRYMGRVISCVQCMPAKPIKHGIKVDLTPVKKLGNGSSTKPSRKTNNINTHYSGEMVMLLEEEGGGDVDSGAMVGHRAPTSNRLSRRKDSSAVDNAGSGGGGGGSKSLLASSHNLYSNRHGGGKKVEGANHGKNLHDRHPVHYLKRGSGEDSDGVD